MFGEGPDMDYIYFAFIGIACTGIGAALGWYAYTWIHVDFEVEEWLPELDY